MCQHQPNLPEDWSSTHAARKGCFVSKMVYPFPHLFPSVPPVHLSVRLLCEPGLCTVMIKNTGSLYKLALTQRKTFSFSRKVWDILTQEEWGGKKSAKPTHLSCRCISNYCLFVYITAITLTCWAWHLLHPQSLLMC